MEKSNDLMRSWWMLHKYKLKTAETGTKAKKQTKKYAIETNGEKGMARYEPQIITRVRASAKKSTNDP